MVPLIRGGSVPDGKTVTPVNDVIIWQQCAGIDSPEYDTLAGVLSDTSLVNRLMMSENAVDYLVRCTGWIVSEAFVPTMTSNTTPSGIAFASSEYSARQAYTVFDGTTNAWQTNNTSTTFSNIYVGYESSNTADIGTASFSVGTPRVTAMTYKFQGSNTGNSNDWHDLTDELTTFNTTGLTVTLNGNDEYSQYRMLIVSQTHSQSERGGMISSLQFYTASIIASAIAMSAIGASDYAAEALLSDATWNKAIQNSKYFESVDNVKVPTMTSNTTPSGVCSASTYQSSYPAWKAFDGDESTSWGANATSFPQYVAYAFTESVRIVKATVITTRVATMKIQALDNDTWVDLCDTQTMTDAIKKSIVLNNINQYQEYKALFVSGNSSGHGAYAREIQLYGRQPGGIQTWLYAAGISDKTYTTISEVLADTTTLTTLMNSAAAVDYLVTTKVWINNICSNATAMTAIGNNNYASNTLLDNSNWRAAICSSAYFESVLNVKVPVMTSNTTPSGTVSADSSTVSSYPAWQAFDGKNGTLWITSLKANAYIQYRFTTPQKIHCAFVYPYYDSNGIHVGSFYIVGSNNGSTWSSHLVDDSFANIETTGKAFIIDDDNSYTYFRLFIVTNGGNSAASISCRTVQFYGRQDI